MLHYDVAELLCLMYNILHYAVLSFITLLHHVASCIPFDYVVLRLVTLHYLVFVNICPVRLQCVVLLSTSYTWTRELCLQTFTQAKHSVKFEILHTSSKSLLHSLTRVLPSTIQTASSFESSSLTHYSKLTSCLLILSKTVITSVCVTHLFTSLFPVENILWQHQTYNYTMTVQMCENTNSELWICFWRQWSSVDIKKKFLSKIKTLTMHLKNTLRHQQRQMGL